VDEDMRVMGMVALRDLAANISSESVTKTYVA